MLTFEDTIQAVESIEKTVNSATDGWANPVAINAIQSQILVLRNGRGSAYISEKIVAIEANTIDLYSPRKAEKWGGGEHVKRAILAACQSLKDHAEILELRPGCGRDA